MAHSNKPIPESKALPPHDPALDENDWPIYNLRNVEVVAQNGLRANLLHADSSNPLTLTGTLETLERKRAGLLLPYASSRSRNPTILLRNVTHFSYGVYENGDVDIWAAGGAGWYRIKPAERYGPIFQGMLEGVSILYFTADCYRDGKISAEELFLRYSQVYHVTSKEAKEKFYAHGRFLASRMMKGFEGVKWGHTSLYQHLRRLQPESFGIETSAPSFPRTATSRIQKESAPSRSQSEDQQRSRSRRSRHVEPVKHNPDPKDKKRKRESMPSELKTVKATTTWKFLQSVVNNNLPDPGEVTLEFFSVYLMRTFTFQDEHQASQYLQYLAADLVSMIQRKGRRTYRWSELPFYNELLECNLSAVTKRKMAAIALDHRVEPLPDEMDDAISSVISDSSEEQVLDEEQLHHTKSGLRPKSGSKFSRKGAGRRGKGLQKQVEGNESDDGEPIEVETPSKSLGIPENDDSDSPPESKKRFTRSQGDQDPELEDLEFAWQQARSTHIPIRRKSSKLQGTEYSDYPAPRPMVATHPILGTEATDPGDVWSCSYEGCLHKVYGASNEDSKELIKEHMNEHQPNEKIDLIISEQNRTHLPVSKLIKRIRELAELQNDPTLNRFVETGMSEPMTALFPPRIMRRV